MGSLDEVDIVKEDLNRSEQSRATGYMGKNSEVVWMQRLELQTNRLDNDDDDAGDHRMSQSPAKRSSSAAALGDDIAISSASYHLDNLDYLGLVASDPSALPPKEVADKLLHFYLKSADSSFPIIRRSLFMAQYQSLFSSESLPKPGEKWLTILNLIFAIGALFCEHAQPADFGKSVAVDHRLFFSRARSLSAGDNTLYDNPDLQQVQIEGLVAFYFLGSSQINRYYY